MPALTSRKFIDLIWSATSKWANWDPGHQMKVGDFGIIDKESGVFDRKGNIYEDLSIYDGDEKILQKVRDNPPESAPREDQYIATSANVKRSDLTLGHHISLGGVAEASIKGEWTFGSKRGALLVMARPQSYYIPHGKLLEHLCEIEALKGMVLVTEVFFCPAYSLYLSSGQNDVVSLALVGSAPLPHAPGVIPGAGVGMEWWVQHTTGLFRNGREPYGKDSYTPLYMLKKIRRKGWFTRVEFPPVFEGDNLWTDIEPPWEQLDEEGNEDHFVDTVFE